jgi:CubicO group peptidase (beta-lactamase class C family)
MALKKYIFLISLSLCFTIGSNAQDFQELDSIASRLIDTFKIKGIALIGVKDGQVVYEGVFGKANEEYKMAPEIPLYIASNTKAFIGLAMARLVVQGKIGMDDPMIKYIDRDYFPSEIKVASITIKDVLSHSHGLSNDPITFRTAYSGEYPDNLQELLKYTSYYPEGDTLIKKHRYSNFGYLLAGIIIYNVTGMNWKEYLQKSVLSPLGMNHTSPYMPKGIDAKKMAKPYTFSTDQPLKVVKKDNTLHAAGGLFTDLKDMGAWLSFFTGGANKASNVFNEDLNDYFEPLVSTDDSLGPLKITGYGYGWYFGTLFGMPFNFHTGGFSGHASFMSYMPEQNLGFFAFTNESSSLYRSVLHLVILYYSIMTENSGKDEVNAMFSKMTRQLFDKYNKEESQLQILDLAELPLGTFYHPEYGTLKINRTTDHFEVLLGNNLSSPAYKGESANEIVVEFVPGSMEHFFIEGENENFRIRYGDDYGYFYPAE